MLRSNRFTFGGRKKFSSRHARCGLRQLRLESLESRQLLAGDVANVALGFGDAENPLVTEQRSPRAPLPDDATAFERFSSSDELADYLLETAISRYGHLLGTTEPVWHDRCMTDFCIRPMMIDVQFNGLDIGLSSFRADTTNVQVFGVDEADVVETDGRYLYMLSGNRLTIVDAQDPTDLRTVSRIDLDSIPGGMYLHEGRLTTVSTGSGFRVTPALGMLTLDTLTYGLPPSDASVTVFDVADPANPVRIRQLAIDGHIVDSRMVGSQLTLVMSENLTVPFPKVIEATVEGTEGSEPEEGQRYETEEEFRARVRAEVLDSLPSYREIDASGEVTELGQFLPVTSIYKPGEGATERFLTALTIDAGAEQPDILDSKGVFASYLQTVYMAQESLYLASTGWDNSIQVQRFAVDAVAGDINLTAARTLPGRLVNRFALDEHDGYLRIATTVGDGVVGVTNELHVLSIEGSELETVGSITGIAPGETIQSVRFMEDTAVVVTFRRVDPLFGLDLSDPRNPQILGELKITGFSEYLLPIDEDHVVGIGHDADPETGWVQEMQLSLFDISDLTQPELVDRYSFSESVWSQASFDPHAVTYLADDGLLSLPTAGYSGSDLQHELYVFEITPDSGITLRNQIEHATHVRRSVPIGEALISVSSAELIAARIDDLQIIDRLKIATVANPDEFEFTDFAEWQLDVLANDVIADEADNVRIVEVSSAWGLEVQIAEDGQTLLASKDPDDASPPELWGTRLRDAFLGPRVGQHFGFSYTIEDGLGGRSSSWVNITVSPELWAVGDSVVVSSDETDTTIAVLDNDIATNDGVQIVAVDPMNSLGDVRIAADGQSIVYTAPEVRAGGDRFGYTIQDSVGNVSSATVNVYFQAPSVSPTDMFVEYSLDVFDADGNVVTDVQVGDEFIVQLYVQDISASPHGVFAAYADIGYDAELVEVAGLVEFGAEYGGGQSSDLSEAGVVDEIGAVAGISATGPGRVLLASIPFRAVAQGPLEFSLDAADDTVQHITLVYGAEASVPVEQISYVNASLEVHAVADPADVNLDGVISPLDAMLVINELTRRVEANEEMMVRAAAALTAGESDDAFMDVNRDGVLSPLDAMLIINELPTATEPRSALSTLAKAEHGVPAIQPPSGALLETRIVDLAIGELVEQAASSSTQPDFIPDGANRLTTLSNPGAPARRFLDSLPNGDNLSEAMANKPLFALVDQILELPIL